jgi:hypothetical protein
VPLRAAVIGCLLLALAACNGGGSGSTASSTRGPETSAFFVTGENTIEVRGFGRLPLEQAELIAPDGTVQTALDRQNDYVTDDYYSRPTVGVGGAGGSRGSAVGVGISFPILEDRSSGAFYRSRASFPILDMPLYRLTWRDWRIRMRFQGAGEPARQVELPAPEPPAPPPAEAPPSSPQSR